MTQHITRDVQSLASSVFHGASDFAQTLALGLAHPQPVREVVRQGINIITKGVVTTPTGVAVPVSRAERAITTGLVAGTIISGAATVATAAPLVISSLGAIGSAASQSVGAVTSDVKGLLSGKTKVDASDLTSQLNLVQPSVQPQVLPDLPAESMQPVDVQDFSQLDENTQFINSPTEELSQEVEPLIDDIGVLPEELSWTSF